MKISKKLLSLTLAVLMILSCITVGIVSVSAATGDTVYLRNSAGWATPYCYMWKGQGGVGNENHSWPGVAMTPVGEGVYSYTLTDNYEMVIFTDGGAQTDNLDYPGDSKIYDYATGQWSEFDGGHPKPVINVSKKSGTSYNTATMDVEITVTNADTASYSISGDVSNITFAGSTTATMGYGLNYSESQTLTVTATNENGTTTQEYTYSKKKAPTGGGGSSSTGSGDMGCYYGTNPNSQVGSQKTISSAKDFTEDMIIAQGIANDDPRIFRGSHEGPVYDTYALYAAWDNDNLYLGVQFVNVTDVVDPAQGYPISDNGKPTNGDIPQIMAFKLGKGTEGNGSMDTSEKDRVWGIKVSYDNPIDAMMCYSSKPGVGQPSLFFTDDNGKFSYAADKLVGFTKGGISFKYEDGFFGSKMMGIKANGYEGYKPADCLDEDAKWVDFLTTKHSKLQDTFMTMTVPLDTLGLSVSDLTSRGIGVMHITTFGESGTGSLPQDPAMLDNACTPYSADESTSAEKEDDDVVSYNFAYIGKLSGGSSSTPAETQPTTPPPVRPGQPSTVPTNPATQATDPTESTIPTTAPTTATTPVTVPTTAPTTSPVVTTQPTTVTEPTETGGTPIYTVPTAPTTQATKPTDTPIETPPADTTQPTSATLPVIVDPTLPTSVTSAMFYIVGDLALTGADWKISSATAMTAQNGLYYLTINNVPAGKYEFKVVDFFGNWHPDGTDNNSSVIVPINGLDVVFCYDPAQGYPIASTGVTPQYPTIPSTEPTTGATAPTTGVTEPTSTYIPPAPTMPVEEIKLSKISLKAGATKTISNPYNIIKSIKSSNSKIFKVLSSKKIVALTKGTATLTVTTKSGNKVTTKVTVTTNPKLSKTSVTVKAKGTVTVKITGKASSVNNTYTNTKIAKVTSAKSATTLKIKGLKRGTTTLKIKVNGKTLSLKVKVK